MARPLISRVSCCFFFNDTATTEIYTLSLHDALPIWSTPRPTGASPYCPVPARRSRRRDRKSTRLNSSHMSISYAVFCLKKKHTSLLRRWPGGGGRARHPCQRGHSVM